MADKDVAEARDPQCVVFSIGNEHYGIDIFQVREIIRVPAVTHVPGAPDDVQGVINLRGGVIPSSTCGNGLGWVMPVREQDRRIVVVEFDEQTVGIVVDGVSEVLEIDAAINRRPRTSCRLIPTPSPGCRTGGKVDHPARTGGSLYGT